MVSASKKKGLSVLPVGLLIYPRSFVKSRRLLRVGAPESGFQVFCYCNAQNPDESEVIS